jgi:amino acid permease
MSSRELGEPLVSSKAPSQQQQSNEQKKHAASTLRTAINVTKCFVGAASFELPWAFAEAGVIGGVVGVCFLAVLSSFSLQRLAACSSLVAERQHERAKVQNRDTYYDQGGNDESSSSGAAVEVSQAPTYPDVGQEALGLAGKLLAWFGVVAMSLGVCGSYFVFICSTLAQLTGVGTQTLWVFIVLPLVIVLSWIRHVATFAWTSSFGVLALVVAVIICTVDATVHGHNVTIDWGGSGSNDTMPLLTLATYPLFLGNAGYLYLISTAILPVSQSMREPTKFGAAFMPSIAFVTVVNVAFGLYAAIRYGGHVCPDGANTTHTNGTELDCVSDNVLNNMAPGIPTTLVKWALLVDLLFTTIVFLFPLNEAIEQALLVKLLQPAPGWRHFWSSRHTWAVNGLRAGVGVAIAAVALGVPVFSLLTGLTGGFGNNVLGFILPPVFYWRLRGTEYWRAKDKRCSRVAELLGLAITFVFGLVFLVLTLYFFTKQIIHSRK